MTLDLSTLRELLNAVDISLMNGCGVPLVAGQVHAAQHVLQGIFGKLWAIRVKYQFKVDTKLFSHQAHEFDWEIVLPETKETPTD